APASCGGAARVVRRARLPPPVVRRPRGLPGALARNAGDGVVHLERDRLRFPRRNHDHAAPVAHGPVRRLPGRVGGAGGRPDGAAADGVCQPARLARHGAAGGGGRAGRVALGGAELRQRPRLGGGQPGAAIDDRADCGRRPHGRRHVGGRRHQQRQPAARPDARRRDPRGRGDRRRVLGERRALRRGARGGTGPARPRPAAPPVRRRRARADRGRAGRGAAGPAAGRRLAGDGRVQPVRLAFQQPRAGDRAGAPAARAGGGRAARRHGRRRRLRGRAADRVAGAAGGLRAVLPRRHRALPGERRAVRAGPAPAARGRGAGVERLRRLRLQHHAGDLGVHRLASGAAKPRARDPLGLHRPGADRLRPHRAARGGHRPARGLRGLRGRRAAGVGPHTPLVARSL
ncbi:MAG: hypothetical protein AVDCRST_MAG04-1716, partial [uncultured Acetobacteraceae bacterium]